ncbi:MAG: MAPEG family protein [Acidiferrobacterales bacterium]|nr:MAPEG family protein [Acidiferrobacterales bacterium]
MSFLILVTVALLVQYTYFSMRAGLARDKADVKAPAMSGDEYFERCLRVQMNTLEQLVVTIPAMWVCAIYLRMDVAVVLGLLFLIGRFIYSFAYLNEPSSRGKGMMIGFIANMALLLCCLIAALIKLF